MHILEGSQVQQTLRVEHLDGRDILKGGDDRTIEADEIFIQLFKAGRIIEVTIARQRVILYTVYVPRK